MKNSDERPFGSHRPEERICAFCGDAFYATHGLQKYCPDKFGKIDYCKYEQKKMVTEAKLVELVKEVNEAVNPPFQRLSPLEQNIHILGTILGPYGQVNTDSDRLNTMGFDITVFSRRILEGHTDYVTLVFGHFELIWKRRNEAISTFKIKKL